MGFKNIEGQLARWIEELAVYNVEIVHRPGKDHVNADGLSRIPDLLVQCNYYSYGCDVQDLSCGGCLYCAQANKQWDRLHITRVILSHMKMLPGWKNIRHKI